MNAPYDCLLISVALVVLYRAGCLWITGVFLVLGRSFKLGFAFVCLLYTFQLHSQLEIGRHLSLQGDYISHVSL